MRSVTEPAAAPSPRIGNAEREAAQRALEQHMEAGRLNVEEFSERSGRVAAARTADDLLPVFSDLPGTLPPATTSKADVATTTASDGGSTLARWGPRVSGAMPLLALILFLTVPIPNAWIFFLLIPLAGMLFAGSRQGRDDRGR